MNKKISELVLTKDNFLENYQEIMVYSEKYEYKSCPEGIYPGIRTTNLADEPFAKEIIDKVISLIVPETKNFMYALHFHKNLPYEDDGLNEGWIHQDPCNITGMIYLTPSTLDQTAGTSFYTQISPPIEDNFVRNKFNISGNNKEEYLNLMKAHNNTFMKVLSVPFVTNRLVIFDSKIPHKPNNYKFEESSKIRKTILFYIDIID